MKQSRTHIILLILLCVILQGCSLGNKGFTNSKNTQYMAVLSDPAIRKDFRSMKAVAANASLYQANGHTYFSEADLSKLDELSAAMVNRLKYDYHLSARRYKIHTFISKNAMNSCYQYYNSYSSNVIGKTCHEFPSAFASCHLCNDFIKALHTRKFSIMHGTWFDGEKTIDLIDTFKLKNGDPVYMGLEISTD